MVFFKKMLDKVGGLGSDVEDGGLPDDVTRDRQLRSFRRQRRTQLESVEKDLLKKQIADFDRDFVRKNMFGISDNAPRVRGSLLSAQGNLSGDSPFFEKKPRVREVFERKEGSGGSVLGVVKDVKKSKPSYLGKGDIL